MHRGWRAATLSFIGIVPFLCLLAMFGAALPARAFFSLTVDGEVVPAADPLVALDSGLGVALPLLVSEMGFAVDDSAYPAVELRFDGRQALLVVGDEEAVVDGKAVRLSAAPKEQRGRLYVPLTLAADLARLRIELNVAAGTVGLTRRDGGPVRTARGPAPAATPLPDIADATPQDPVSDDAFGGTGEGAAVVVPSGDREAVPGESEAAPAVEEGQRQEEHPPGVHRLGDDESDRSATATIDGPPAVVRDIRIVHKDGHVHIELSADGPLGPRVMFLDNPARLVIDVEKAVAAPGWRTAPGDGRIVKQLRVNGADDGGLRIVADLTAPTGYTLETHDEEGVYRVKLNHQLQILGAEPEGDDVALRLRATGPVPYRMFRLKEPERLVIDLFGVSIPEAAERAHPGPWSPSLRVSQFEQSAVRAVFELADGVAGIGEPREGVLHPDAGGLVHLLVHPDGFVSVEGPAAAPADNRLRFVGVGRHDDLEYVLLQADEPLEVAVSRLRGPDRIVLDLSGVAVERSLGLVPEDGAVLRAVRAGQAEDATARIVAETTGVAEHYLLLSPDKTRAVLALRPSKLAGRTIVVDAGHGGRDPGAIGHAGTYEKDVTLSIALQVADLLGQAGANVVLTRDRDIELALAERAQLANVLRADAFVSIHADAVGFGRIASGTSTFYHPENGSSGGASLNRQYALTLQNELLQALGLPDRGVHERAFHVVLNTKMPSALVEVGFIDNPEEEQLLLDPDFQARAAAGVAGGIVRFFADEAATAPEDGKAWQRRAAEVTGLWVLLGTVPAEVVALEPAPAFTLARSEGRGASEPELDMTATPRFPEL